MRKKKQNMTFDTKQKEIKQIQNEDEDNNERQQEGVKSN